jgi:hypothetical protein
MSSKYSKQVRMQSTQKLRDGYVAHLATESVHLGSTVKTPADVEADVKSTLDAEHAAEVARGAFHGAIADARAKRQAIKALLAAIKQLALSRFVDQPEILADFGLTPPKAKRVLTAEEQLAAAKLRASTRKARQTMGPRQRAKVKGKPPEPTPPAPAPAAPPVTPAPPQK